jgi:hypothetical protein
MRFTPIVSHQVPQKRMPRPRPQPIAFALVVAHFVSQLRIAQRRQRIGGNELPFA